MFINNDVFKNLINLEELTINRSYPEESSFRYLTHIKTLILIKAIASDMLKHMVNLKIM